MTGYRTIDGYLDDMESVAQAVAALLRPNAHLVINAATTVDDSGDATPLAEDIAVRLARHLVRRPDLPIEWDVPPSGVVDDRCIVFQKLRQQQHVTGSIRRLAPAT